MEFYSFTDNGGPTTGGASNLSLRGEKKTLFEGAFIFTWNGLRDKDVLRIFENLTLICVLTLS